MFYTKAMPGWDRSNFQLRFVTPIVKILKTPLLIDTLVSCHCMINKCCHFTEKRVFRLGYTGGCFWHTVQLVNIFDRQNLTILKTCPYTWALLLGHQDTFRGYITFTSFVIGCLNHFFQLFNTFDKDLIYGITRVVWRQPKLWFSYFISFQSSSASKWLRTNLGNRMSYLRTMKNLDAHWGDIVFQFCCYQKSQLSTEISKAN